MKVIGIIGGIGSGKSTVVAIMSNLEPIKVISADLIGHEILKKGNKAYEPVINVFGEQIIDENNQIDRKKLGEIVFSSPSLLKTLNQITHPIITEEIMSLINEYKTNLNSGYIILESALLIESGLIELTDIVIAVHAEVNERTKRVINRDNISNDQIMGRMNAQKKWEEISKYADYTINNNANLEDTKNQVIKLLKILKEET